MSGRLMGIDADVEEAAAKAKAQRLHRRWFDGDGDRRLVGVIHPIVGFEAEAVGACVAGRI